MASEASYVYILSGQMPKMVHFDEFFSNLKFTVKKCYQNKKSS